jgi:hypothetical protein
MLLSFSKSQLVIYKSSNNDTIVYKFKEQILKHSFQKNTNMAKNDLLYYHMFKIFTNT